MIDICKNLANTSATVTPHPSTNPIPYKTARFDEGHLHCTLPIWGLPPEGNSTIDNTKDVQSAKFMKPPLKLAKISQTNTGYHDTMDCQIELTKSSNKPSQRTGDNSCNNMSIWPPHHPSKGQTLGMWMLQDASKDRVQPLEQACRSTPS